MTASGQQQTAAPGSGAAGSMALALVDQPTNQDLYDLSDYDSSDSDNQDDFLPPGPLEAEKCTLSGPGFTGGAAGSPVSFVITAKDGRSKRIRDGGAYVRVQVQPMRGVNAERVDPSIKDHGDGSYTVTYSVSVRGNYEVNWKYAVACLSIWSYCCCTVIACACVALPSLQMISALKPSLFGCHSLASS